MGTVQPSVAAAVPTAVVPTASTSAAIDTKAQLGPYQPMTGSSVVPEVPTSGQPDEAPASPEYAGESAPGSGRESGSQGAPSVPSMGGVLFKAGPIDPHYASPNEGGTDPYEKVNNPPTRGMLTLIKTYANHVFNGKQNVDAAGWQQNSAQQRTSYMRITPPPHADGYTPETYVPHQLPQSAATYKYGPVLGNDPYGSGVLNRDTYGAGQTAGGVGGQTYSPAPGPPDTTSTAQSQPQSGGMPSWG